MLTTDGKQHTPGFGCTIKTYLPKKTLKFTLCFSFLNSPDKETPEGLRIIPLVLTYAVALTMLIVLVSNGQDIAMRDRDTGEKERAQQHPGTSQGGHTGEDQAEPKGDAEHGCKVDRTCRTN